MVLERKPFEPQRFEEEREKDAGKVFTVRLNAEELERLEASKKALHQPKDSTALKMLADIGYDVLHDQLTGKIMKRVFINKANNKRQGIEYIE